MTGAPLIRALLGVVLVAQSASAARELRADPEIAPIETVRQERLGGRQAQIDAQVASLRSALDRWQADLRSHPSAAASVAPTDLRLTEALDAFLRLEVDRQAALASSATAGTTFDTAVEVGLDQVEVLARSELMQLARDWCARLATETPDPRVTRWTLKLAALADDSDAVVTTWRQWETTQTPLTTDPFLRLLAARAALAQRDLDLAIRLSADAPPDLAAAFAVVAAQSAIARGDLAKATASVGPFADGRPRLLWSQLRLSTGDVATARSGFTDLLDRGQLQAEAHAGLAWCDLREGHWQEAAQHLQEAADLAPLASTTPAWRLLGARCRLRAGDRDLRPIDAAAADLDRRIATVQSERQSPPVWLDTEMVAAAPEATDPNEVGHRWRQVRARRQRLDAQAMVDARLCMWRDPLRTADQLNQIATDLHDLDGELAEAEADLDEARYWSRREVEHRLLPARAWQGRLEERDATLLRDQVRFAMQRFAAQERRYTRLREELTRLVTTAERLDRHQRRIAELQAPLLASLAAWPLTEQQRSEEQGSVEDELLPAWQRVCDAATRRLRALKAIAEVERIRVEAQP